MASFVANIWLDDLDLIGWTIYLFTYVMHREAVHS